MIFTIQTKGNTDIIDITDKISQVVAKHNITGAALVFVNGSTASVTTIENDNNLYDDFRDLLNSLIPIDKDWKHHRTWNDDNGGSHLRASLFGPSVTIPLVNGKLVLGTWQKIVLIDFDTSPRTREITVTCLTATSGV